MEQEQHHINEEEVQIFNKEPEPEPEGAAPVAEADNKKKRDYFLPASILIAAVLIAAAIIFAIMHKGGGATQPVAGFGAATTTPVAEIMKIANGDIVLGQASAPVTVIEYSDYQCPYCGKFFTETQPLIVSNYVNTGKVRMVFRNFSFLGPESSSSAQAAECALDQGQTQAAEYHDALYTAKYAEETGGGSENDGSMDRTFLLKIAQQVKLDIPTFTTCIDSNKYAAQIDQEKADGIAAGVNSTPTFFINGQEVEGAVPYAQFKAGIDTLLNAQ
jgi:protein-disulfide isomerase